MTTRLLRRATGLLLTLFLGQLLLVGGEYACGSRDAGLARWSERLEHSFESHRASVETHETFDGCGGESTGTTCGDVGDEIDCLLMVTCGVTAFSSSLASAPEVERLTTRVVTVIAKRPASLTIAPEPPPPRA
jgi:hypothetical protein